MVKAKPDLRRIPRNPLVWIVSGAGLVVIVAALMIVALDAAGRSTPADLTVVELARSYRSGATILTVEVRNAGDETAAGVGVRGTAVGGAVSEIHLDYVAGRSRREAALAFPSNTGPVTLAVTGWSSP